MTEEVKEMIVHVIVEIFQGIVNDVKVFSSEKSANKAETAWLKEHDITSKVDHEGKAQNGTELLLFQCEVEA